MMIKYKIIPLASTPKTVFCVGFTLHKKNCFGDLSKSKRCPKRNHRCHHIKKKLKIIKNNGELTLRQAKNLANKLSKLRIYGKPMLRNIYIREYYAIKNN